MGPIFKHMVNMSWFRIKINQKHAPTNYTRTPLILIVFVILIFHSSFWGILRLCVFPFMAGLPAGITQQHNAQPLTAWVSPPPLLQSYPGMPCPQIYHQSNMPGITWVDKLGNLRFFLETRVAIIRTAE